MLTFLCCIAGFATGFIGSIAGGGGFIDLPMLLLLGMPPLTAIGTHKFVVCWGGLTSVVNYARHRVVRWKLAAGLVIFGIVGSSLGVRLVMVMHTRLLDAMLSIVLPLGMIGLVVFQSMKKDSGVTIWNPPSHLHLRNALMSGGIGIYEGMVGPGTGPLALLGLHHLIRLPMLEAAATARVLTFATSLWAMGLFALNGSLDFTFGIPMALSCILGSVVESQLAVRLGAIMIRRVLYVVLVVLAASMIWKKWLC